MIRDVADEFARYRAIAERALAQIPDDRLNRIPAPDGNSATMLVRHIEGNLRSRFTDFLATDGEKPWRERDREFEERERSRVEIEKLWAEGWSVLDGALAGLSDADLEREVTIRGKPLTVGQALLRSLAHLAYHVGQIVLIARQSASADWQWISIPKR